VIDKELLSILACPETHQALAEAEPALLERVNRAIAAGRVRNRAGKAVSEPIEGGLLREDRKVLYPIREEIPVLLIEEGLVLEDAPSA
jgi:uncharacterized protein YbaR (Trm112 family)